MTVVTWSWRMLGVRVRVRGSDDGEEEEELLAEEDSIGDRE